RGLPHPTAADQCHDPLLISTQKFSYLLGLRIAVLKMGRYDRWRVDELRPRGRGGGAFGLTLLLQPDGDALLGAALGGHWVGHQFGLTGDPLPQLLHVLHKPRPPAWICSRQFPFGFSELVPQFLQYPFRASHEAEIVTQPRQAGLEVVAELDVLPRRQAER